MSTPEPQRISPKKIEANRRNAQHSTGPRTAAGKDRSKRSAFKHGLTAKEVLITAGDGKESKREFEQLLAGFRDYFCPVGLPEELLVDEIAICFWNKKRGHRFQTGAIRDRADTARSGLGPDFEDVKYSPEDPRRSSLGLDYLLDGLQRAKEEIRHGMLSAEQRAFLAKYFAFQGLSQVSVKVDETLNRTSVEREQLLNEIAAEQAALRARKKSVKEEETIQQDARLRRLALPDSHAIDTLLRYAAANNNQLTKLLDQLDRLQARRKATGRHEAAGGAGAAG